MTDRTEMVGVLGTTRLGGESVTPRQRALVAALALRGETGASTGELVDDIWHSMEPPSARQALQNQIARLRRRFGDRLIVTDGSTYRLHWATDAEFFDEQVTLARRHPVAAASIPLLEQALACWRGQPYADLEDHPVAQAERARLGELRSAAADHLAVCRLSVGDNGRAVAELRGALELEPFRERTWGLLVLALYRDGRRTEALAAYRRLEESLRAELGCAPSSSLRELRVSVERGEEIDLRDHYPVVDDAPSCARTRRQHRHTTSHRGS